MMQGKVCLITGATNGIGRGPKIKDKTEIDE